jgi:hypothetical protein
VRRAGPCGDAASTKRSPAAEPDAAPEQRAASAQLHTSTLWRRAAAATGGADYTAAVDPVAGPTHFVTAACRATAQAASASGLYRLYGGVDDAHCGGCGRRCLVGK